MRLAESIINRRAFLSRNYRLNCRAEIDVLRIATMLVLRKIFTDEVYPSGYFPRTGTVLIGRVSVEELSDR